MEEDIDIDIHSIPSEDYKKYTLVDIREAAELDASPCMNECAHVPLSQFPANADFFKADQSYLIFCAKGGRSHYMAEVLVHNGFKAWSVNNGVSSVNAYLSNIS